MRLPRRRVLALAGTSSVLASAGCLSSLVGPEDTPESNGTTENQDVRPLTLAKGSPKNLIESDEVYSGWVHVVAHGETYDLTFDVRLCHERGREVTVDLYGLPGADYDLEFATGASETRATTPESAAVSNCEFGTRINGSSTLSLEFERLRVTANRRVLQTIEREGTTAVMRPLPDPIDARSDETTASRG